MIGMMHGLCVYLSGNVRELNWHERFRVYSIIVCYYILGNYGTVFSKKCSINTNLDIIATCSPRNLNLKTRNGEDLRI